MWKKEKSIPHFMLKDLLPKRLFKALGTGIRKGINFKNIEILNDNYGKPYIKLKGSTEKIF